MKLIKSPVHYGLLVVLSLLLYSCNKVENPFEGIENGGGVNPVISSADSIWGDTGNTTIRKMLIEEFTGEQCGFCPPKTKLIVDWADTEFKGKVYSIVYHAGVYAEPNAKYPNDHRTIKGTDFYDNLGIASAPVALFSRLELYGSLVIQGAKFEAEFRKLETSGYFNNPKIHIKTLNLYDRDENSNRIIVTATALSELKEPHTVIIYITEDPVIGDQVDYDQDPKDLHNYPHRHMFRDAIGPLDGNAFIDSDLAVGESVTKTYSTTLDASKWDPSKVNFTIAIRNNTTGEIIQVDEVHARK
ncbi:MAG: hypothetical protein CL840_02860 [Crocinitomicaceae bacterium]|nr:hypothetical protein [Crocinitomicaceae bacterium]|tara:strand:+ start:41730 stop:42632 length:903 start_codon:yes stop_codon:yes gene_type:complete